MANPATHHLPLRKPAVGSMALPVNGLTSTNPKMPRGLAPIRIGWQRRDPNSGRWHEPCSYQHVEPSAPPGPRFDNA